MNYTNEKTDNKKSACECFGYEEENTEKWAVKLMKVWHNCITAIWIFIGMFTFAPVTFLAKKLNIKKTWLAVTLATLIYIAFVLIPLWVYLIVR